MGRRTVFLICSILIGGCTENCNGNSPTPMPPPKPLGAEYDREEIDKLRVSVEKLRKDVAALVDRAEKEGLDSAQLAQEATALAGEAARLADELEKKDR